jgi:hypothetical protein
LATFRPQDRGDQFEVVQLQISAAAIIGISVHRVVVVVSRPDYQQLVNRLICGSYALTYRTTKELDDITRNDRYPFSERIRTLTAILGRLRPEPSPLLKTGIATSVRRGRRRS